MENEDYNAKHIMWESNEIFLVKRLACVKGVYLNYAISYTETLELDSRQKLQCFHSLAVFKPENEHLKKTDQARWMLQRAAQAKW